VLKAIGVIPSYGTLRISVGKDTTFDDIVEVVMIIKTIYDELKEDNK
jgi:cysteine sulfinate desulfinase/cysteine desulfurase-like protein